MVSENPRINQLNEIMADKDKLIRHLANHLSTEELAKVGYVCGEGYVLPIIMDRDCKSEVPHMDIYNDVIKDLNNY